MIMLFGGHKSETGYYTQPNIYIYFFLVAVIRPE